MKYFAVWSGIFKTIWTWKMIDKEEIEPTYHDEMLWIPIDQRDKRIVNIDEILKRMDENENLH